MARNFIENDYNSEQMNETDQHGVADVTGTASAELQTATFGSKTRSVISQQKKDSISYASSDCIQKQPVSKTDAAKNLFRRIFTRQHVRRGVPAEAEGVDVCVVCMCNVTKPKRLKKCGHVFCMDCIDQCFAKINPICPTCGQLYGSLTGNMPPGTMNVQTKRALELPGYPGCGAIVVYYNIPDGIQTNEHPHSGMLYHGTSRWAFLPNNAEGQKVCKLLRRAFDARLTFTVGASSTTGCDDQVIWNDIHHKTQRHGGPTSYGYPDPTYLKRVQEELASKGIK